MLIYADFPVQHRTNIHSTKRLNKEVKRRADVVGIFPNEASIIRLVGAVLLEQNDEWTMQHLYMQVEGMVHAGGRHGRIDRRRQRNAALALTA